MKQDYWFEPGDKVIFVATPEELGLVSSKCPYGHIQEKGSVFCVERCWSRPPWGNVVTLVGHPTEPGNGFWACCYRKVEEIRLCVKAAQKVGEPVEVEPEFSQAPENTL